MKKVVVEKVPEVGNLFEIQHEQGCDEDDIVMESPPQAVLSEIREFILKNVQGDFVSVDTTEKELVRINEQLRSAVDWGENEPAHKKDFPLLCDPNAIEKDRDGKPAKGTLMLMCNALVVMFKHKYGQSRTEAYEFAMPDDGEKLQSLKKPITKQVEQLSLSTSVCDIEVGGDIVPLTPDPPAIKKIEEQANLQNPLPVLERRKKRPSESKSKVGLFDADSASGPVRVPVLPLDDDIEPEVKKARKVNADEKNKAEINRFVWAYKRKKEGRGKKKPPVTDMRRNISLIIKCIFDVKAKDMWNKRPKGYDANVPFLDPNNEKKKGQGKPKQDKLFPMCDYLVQKYIEMFGETNENEIVMFDEVKRSHPQTVMAKPISITTQVGQPNPTCKIEGDPRDIAERIKTKRDIVISKGHLVEKDLELLLSTIADHMENKMGVLYIDEEQWLETSHDLELALDLTITQKRLPDRYREKWEAFKEKYFKFQEQIDDVLMVQNKEFVMHDNGFEDLNVASEEEVITTEIEANIHPMSEETNSLGNQEVQKLRIRHISLSDDLLEKEPQEMCTVSGDARTATKFSEKEIQSAGDVKKLQENGPSDVRNGSSDGPDTTQELNKGKMAEEEKPTAQVFPEIKLDSGKKSDIIGNVDGMRKMVMDNIIKIQHEKVALD